MHLPWAKVAVGVTLVGHARARSYFIHETCNIPTRHIKEAFQMASDTYARLQHVPNTDTDFAYVFDITFNTNRDNDANAAIRKNALKRVTNTMKELASMKQIDQYKLADVRLHCDNDAQSPRGRWVRRIGRAGFLDTKNGMLTKGNVLGCEDGDEGGHVLGVTYLNALLSAVHPKDRAAITLCDVAFKYNVTHAETITKDLTHVRGGIDYIVSAPSTLILHELVHAIDIYVGNIGYGWTHIMTSRDLIEVSQQLINADNYSFLGVWGFLANGGFSLQRKGTRFSGPNAKFGLIRHYEDLTKRWLYGASQLGSSALRLSSLGGTK